VLFFAVLAVLLVPGAAGWLWGRRRSVDVLAAALVVCAMAGATAWQLILKAPLDLGLDSPGKVLADLGRTIGLLGESVGLLGWLNIPIDRVVQTAWIIGWLVALIVLVRRTTRRAQLVGATVVVAYVVGNLVLMNALRRTDFGDQARFTIALPIALVVLLAVSQPATTGSPRRGLRRQWPLAVASVIAALGHLSGLLLSAQHNAVGLGRPMTFSATAWAPPGGWPLMLLAFALSCGSLLVLAPLAGRSTA
jgi:hypothetical protein